MVKVRRRQGAALLAAAVAAARAPAATASSSSDGAKMRMGPAREISRSNLGSCLAFRWEQGV